MRLKIEATFVFFNPSRDNFFRGMPACQVKHQFRLIEMIYPFINYPSLFQANSAVIVGYLGTS